MVSPVKTTPSPVSSLCLLSTSETGPSAETPDQKIDYDFAQQELMMQEMGDDPIQDAIEAMEKQHEEEKAGKIPLENPHQTLS